MTGCCISSSPRAALMPEWGCKQIAICWGEGVRQLRCVPSLRLFFFHAGEREIGVRGKKWSQQESNKEIFVLKDEKEQIMWTVRDSGQQLIYLCQLTGNKGEGLAPGLGTRVERRRSLCGSREREIPDSYYNRNGKCRLAVGQSVPSLKSPSSPGRLSQSTRCFPDEEFSN
jgi:hypothetical protein